MLSIISVLYNSEDFIETFIESLLKAVPPNFRIYLVDNNSSDSTFLLSKKYADPRITLLKNKKNLGFAKAVNKIVASLKKSDDILLLNPDSIISRDSINELYGSYKKRAQSIFGGSFIDYKKSKKTTHSAVSSASFSNCLLELTNLQKLPFLHNLNNFWIKKLTEIQEVKAVSGGFMLFSKKIWDDVGGFDERFFLYLEDLDFCIRAIDKGYDIWHNPNAVLSHYSGGSSRGKKGFVNLSAWWRSRDYFFKKNFGTIKYFIYKAISFIEFFLLKLFGKNV